MKKVLILLILLFILLLISIKIIDNYYSESTKSYIYNETKLMVSNNVNNLITNSISPYLDDELVFVNYQNNSVSDVIINTNLYNKILRNINNVLNNVFNNNMDNYFKELNIPIGSLISKNLLAGRGINIKIPIRSVGNYKADLKTKTKSIGINTSILEVVIEVEFVVETIVPLNVQTNTVTYEFLLSSVLIQGEVPNYYYASDALESFPYVPS